MNNHIRCEVMINVEVGIEEIRYQCNTCVTGQINPWPDLFHLIVNLTVTCTLTSISVNAPELA